jgi:capsular polysaccharide export protein
VGLEFGRPTIVLGTAIYDIRGMTHQGGLKTFWRTPESPNPEVFYAFSRVVTANTQINGAYATIHGIDLAIPELVCRLIDA